MVSRKSTAYNRLVPIDLTSFVGGVNLRSDQFTLADDESPDLLNVDIDPRGGFYTRKGWQRWNVNDIVDTETVTWAPRNAAIHVLANDFQVFVVNGATVYAAPSTSVFAPVAGITVAATPHGADFASWGEDVYIAGGMSQPAHRRSSAGVVTAMAPATFSEVDAPTLNTMPQSEYCETHAGYMFVAGTNEAGANHFNRVRWSHPNHPDAFRSLDFFDVDQGGGRITALVSYQDHLLIFKTKSLWALYGYGEDSWQLIKVSSSIGCPAVTATTRSETAVFFFSSSNRGGIYAYSGGEPTDISEKLRTAFEDMIDFNNVFVTWVGRRLWVSVPWTMLLAGTNGPSSVFVFDPNVGQGAWTIYSSSFGSMGPMIENSDIQARCPLGAFWSPQTAGVVQVDCIDDAYDIVILPGPVLGVDPGLGIIVTDLDAPLGVDGPLTGQPFTSYYRTRWLHGGMPDLRKSWRRPMFICRRVPDNVDLLIESYRDYDQTTVRRTRTLVTHRASGGRWTELGADDIAGEGFDWTVDGAEDPRGSDWGSVVEGSVLVRGGPLGHAAAIQMRVSGSPSTLMHKWGVDGIVVKTLATRFRT